MAVLITGNLGYVGGPLTRMLRGNHNNKKLIGLDTGYFSRFLTSASTAPETLLDKQYFVDVRDVELEHLQGVEAVVHLAAISNDPMGNQFEAVTRDINFKSSIRIAELAKQAGAKLFAFASSCSVYGSAGEEARTEESEVNPLTAYAKSKVDSETALRELANDNFKVTCLRFATACGMSDRLRLDLVLNDFVTNAVVHKNITLLSDGSSWRPLIHVQDMARVLQWAATERGNLADPYLILNSGSNKWNYRIRELATGVGQALENIEVKISGDAQVDKRSYRVNFDKLQNISQLGLPKEDLANASIQLRQGLSECSHYFGDNFRNSNLIRLKVLKDLLESGQLTKKLYWNRS